MRELSNRLRAAADWSFWTGTFGSVLLALGAIGIGWLPPRFNLEVNRLLGFLREGDGGQVASHIAIVLGGALLLHAWLVFGLKVLTSKARHRSWLALVAWTSPLILTPPLFSRDVYSYIAQGRLLGAGFNPYESGVAVLPGWFSLGVDPTWAETPTPYGPVFLAIQWAIVTVTGGSTWWSLVLFRLIMLGSLAVTAYAVGQLAKAHGINPSAAVWLAVLNPLSIMHLVSGVHNDSLMIAAMCVGFWQAFSGRRWLALIAIMVAIGVKPIALLALPFITLARLPRKSSQWQRIREFAIDATLVLLTLVALGFALQVGIGWVKALTTPGAVTTFLSPTTVIGTGISLVASWFGSEISVLALTITRSIGMLIAIGLIARILLKPPSTSPLHSAAVAFTVLVVLSPVVQPWYLLWALPLVSAAGVRSAWHLRTIVVGTAFFVIYGLTEANLVADSALGYSDLLSTFASALVVAVVLLTNPAERELTLGKQFAPGLKPRTASDETVWQLQVVQPD